MILTRVQHHQQCPGILEQRHQTSDKTSLTSVHMVTPPQLQGLPVPLPQHPAYDGDPGGEVTRHRAAQAHTVTQHHVSIASQH